MVSVKNKKIIVVLGMHRSGTSLLARSLQVLGVDLGNNLMPPLLNDNEKGFWEDVEITAFNVKILDVIGKDWFSLSSINLDDIDKLVANGYFSQAKKLILEKSAPYDTFGFKDPRVSKLLPFWQKVFDDCGFDIRYVIAIRNPLSVAMSLHARNSFNFIYSYFLWLEYTITSLMFTRSERNVCIVDFDLMMSNTKNQLDKMSKALDLPVDEKELSIFVNEFIDSGLQHHQNNVDQLKKDKDCPELVFKLYIGLLDSIQGFSAEFDVDLIGWYEEFNRIKKLLSFVDSDQLIKKNLEQEISINSLIADDLKQQIEKLNLQISNSELELTQLNKELVELTKAVKEKDFYLSILDKKLFEIQHSSSWRITSPFRIATKLLRNVPLLLSMKGYFLLAKKSRDLLDRLQDFKLPYLATSSGLKIIPHYVDEFTGIDFLPRSSIAVHLHLFYVEMIHDVLGYLKNIPIQFDLFLSTSEVNNNEQLINKIREELPNLNAIVVESVPNRGRDISPLIIQFGKRLLKYDLILHVHTKKSPDSRISDSSFHNDMRNLLGEPSKGSETVLKILKLLETSAKFIFAEEHFGYIKDPSGWSSNYNLAKSFLDKYTNYRIKDFPSVLFPEGSIYWARTECLSEFLDLPLTYEDFPIEPIEPDGSLAHTLERVVLIFTIKHRGDILKICKRDSIGDYKSFEESADFSGVLDKTNIKVLSYYLPQFHPIRENDIWHGKGFTEWSKVKAANPLFEGHYQQHIPHSDLGYYLLDTPDVLRTQQDMMKKSGVYGQIFYHYWFSGKVILDGPVKMLIENKDIDIPFCFCWANENWTRRWDGNESDVLLEQIYSDDDARSFIKYLIPFFKDSRYIRIDDRPVIFVYRPSSIPNIDVYLRVWEDECVANGLLKPYVIAVLTRGASNPNDYGMDAGVERVLHDWTAESVKEINGSLSVYKQLTGSVLNYKDVANYYKGQNDKKDFVYFRSIVPGWDNTARYGSGAYLLHDVKPNIFQYWLESLIRYTKLNLPKDRQFIIVNAWNEWAEGAHLEPDTRHGYAFLNSIGRALTGTPYSSLLNRAGEIPLDKKLHISVGENLVSLLNKDGELKRKFLKCISQSSINRCMSLTIDNKELSELLNISYIKDFNDADYLLTFRDLCLFDGDLIHKLLEVVVSSGAVVIPNYYGAGRVITDVNEDGSVSSEDVYFSPITIENLSKTKFIGYKTYKVCTHAFAFFAYPSESPASTRPFVTTIIRFHKDGNLEELKRALYSLYAMNNCFVVPLIAVQDLDSEQLRMLNEIIDEFYWSENAKPIVSTFESSDNNTDLRSRMLNESLKLVKTRYVGFLDYDDLLYAGAYHHLISRLKLTGKSVAFGRVYKTIFESEKQMFIKRDKSYEYGYSYNDFVTVNHAPIHSFLLDISGLNLTNIKYFDDQKYMEDYLLTLQLFTKNNCDWAGLRENFYIGDYIHSINRSHTLAFYSDEDRQKLISSADYLICEQRVHEMRGFLSYGAKKRF